MKIHLKIIDKSTGMAAQYNAESISAGQSIFRHQNPSPFLFSFRLLTSKSAADNSA
jgi:hypothetical protein